MSRGDRWSNFESSLFFSFLPVEQGALIKPKLAARGAALRTLQKEYGNTLPQAFIRPAYKWVHSPRFPPGLEPYPQVIYDSRGDLKITSRSFSCAHYIDKRILYPEDLEFHVMAAMSKSLSFANVSNDHNNG